MATIQSISEWLTFVCDAFVPDPETRIEGDELAYVQFLEGVLKECESASVAHYRVYGEKAREDFNQTLKGVLDRHWGLEPVPTSGGIRQVPIALYVSVLAEIIDRLEAYATELE